MRPPYRKTQLFCIVLVVVGLLPWGLLSAALMLEAIDGAVPLVMSVAAWLVLLVPLWVVWFAVLAWRRRNETAMPAVLMACPSVVSSALYVLMPLGAIVQ